MKTLIVYSTSYGYAGECAGDLKTRLGGHADMVNIQCGHIPDLKAYQRVILGGSVYMGQLPSGLRHFAEENQEILITKQLGLFLCGVFEEQIPMVMKKSFPEALLRAASARGYFGGELRTARMKWSHRLMTKLVMGKGGGPGSCPEAVRQFAETLAGVPA